MTQDDIADHSALLEDMKVEALLALQVALEARLEKERAKQFQRSNSLGKAMRTK